MRESPWRARLRSTSLSRENRRAGLARSHGSRLRVGKARRGHTLEVPSSSDPWSRIIDGTLAACSRCNGSNCERLVNQPGEPANPLKTDALQDPPLPLGRLTPPAGHA